MQDQRPIAFHSQALKGKNLHLSTYETELLALATVVNKWRSYLPNRPFIVKTDHQSLKFPLERRIATPAQQKWPAKLLGMGMLLWLNTRRAVTIVADALSRKFKFQSKLSQLSGSSKTCCLFLLSVPDPT